MHAPGIVQSFFREDFLVEEPKDKPGHDDRCKNSATEYAGHYPRQLLWGRSEKSKLYKACVEAGHDKQVATDEKGLCSGKDRDHSSSNPCVLLSRIHVRRILALR